MWNGRQKAGKVISTNEKQMEERVTLIGLGRASQV